MTSENSDQEDTMTAHDDTTTDTYRQPDAPITGKVAGVVFGEYVEDEETGELTTKSTPGVFTIKVTGLPEDTEWMAGMTATIQGPPHRYRYGVDDAPGH